MRAVALLTIAAASACGPGMSAELDGRTFVVASAAAFAFEYPTAFTGLRQATVVVFGDEPDLCGALQDVRNYCNHRLSPDVTLEPWGFARPLDVRAPLGWVLLREAQPGPATLLPLVAEPSTLGTSLSYEDGSVLRPERGTASIERIAPGEGVTVSFDSHLAEGHRLRGRVEAGWCEALAMPQDNSNIGRAGLSGGANAVLDGGVVVGVVESISCGSQVHEARCAKDTGGQATCTCFADGVETGTCVGDAAVIIEGLRPCCRARFGDT